MPQPWRSLGVGLAQPRRNQGATLAQHRLRFFVASAQPWRSQDAVLAQLRRWVGAAGAQLWRNPGASARAQIPTRCSRARTNGSSQNEYVSCCIAFCLRLPVFHHMDVKHVMSCVVSRKNWFQNQIIESTDISHATCNPRIRFLKGSH